MSVYKLNHAQDWESDNIIPKDFVYEKCYVLNISSAISGLDYLSYKPRTNYCYQKFEIKRQPKI